MRRLPKFLTVVALSLLPCGSSALALEPGDITYASTSSVKSNTGTAATGSTATANVERMFENKSNWLAEYACGAAAACNDCCLPSCCCCDCGCYGLVEAIFWQRVGRNSDQPVVILTQDAQGNYPGPTVLTVGDVATADVNTGVRATVGYRRGDCSALEATYFGIWDADSSATVTGNDNLAIPGDLGLASIDFFNADRMVVTYGSELHNAELNYVRENCCNDWAWLIGFRYISFDETFNIRSDRDLDTGTSNYNISSSNDLFGGQIGARIVRRHCRWGWDATGKVGIFGNSAEQSQFVTDFPPGFFLRDPVSDTGGQVAFVGDLNLSATYMLNCTWGIRAGYNLLWIEGIATAPGQLDFTDTPTSGSSIVTTGGVFYHGASVGLEANW